MLIAFTRGTLRLCRALLPAGLAVALVVPAASALPSDTHGSGASSDAAPGSAATVGYSQRSSGARAFAGPASSSGTRGLKQQVAGLMNMGGIPDTDYLPAVRGALIQVNWAVMQPTAHGPIIRGGKLDHAIERLRDWNRAHPSQPIAIKLRIMAGIYSPEWVKALAGGGVRVEGYGYAGTSPRFWTTSVQDAYADMLRKVAAAYDDVPELREVVNSLCTTIWAEPMVRQPDASGLAMIRAGYTSALDDQCQKFSFRAATVFRHTLYATSFSPYHRLDPDNEIRQSEDYTLGLMDYCRTALGHRCVLGNNELGKRLSPRGAAMFDRLYTRMRALGAPIYFQMAATANATDPTPAGYYGALAAAAQWGAGGVELYQSYKRWRLSPSSLGTYAARIAANA